MSDDALNKVYAREAGARLFEGADAGANGGRRHAPRDEPAALQVEAIFQFVGHRLVVRVRRRAP